MENKIILQASQISIGYSHKKEKIVVASDISISLKKGKLIALIGANGIGKSTLLKTITGIQKPLSGAVFLNEKKITDYINHFVAHFCFCSVAMVESAAAG